MTPIYHLCLDVGGTKTAAAISNEAGEIVGRGRGGSANMFEVGIVNSAAEIKKATNEAIRELLGGEGEMSVLVCEMVFTDVWIGLSGCDTPLDSTQMTAHLQPFFSSAPLLITNDALLLSSPLKARSTPWGVAVIAGTGSITLGIRMTDGTGEMYARKGGQGYLLGDYGSAYHIGRTAVRFAGDDYDLGREVKGGLAEKLREYYGVQTTMECYARMHDLDTTLDPITSTNNRKLLISALSPLVLTAHLSHCPLATRVLTHCASILASDIAEIVTVAIERGIAGPEGAAGAGLCLAGGVVGQEAYRGMVEKGLEERGVKFGWVEGLGDVAGMGARSMAM